MEAGLWSPDKHWGRRRNRRRTMATHRCHAHDNNLLYLGRPTQCRLDSEKCHPQYGQTSWLLLPSGVHELQGL